MRHFNLSCILLLSFAIGCSQPEKKTAKQNKSIKVKENRMPDIGTDQLVIPGEKIGKISLLMDMNEVFKIFGTPDDGDAAMGKAWSIWNVNEPQESDTGKIAIYSNYKDTTMTSKVVRQIVVSTKGYRTKNGMRNNADLAEMSSLMPSLKKVATYINDSSKDTIHVFDAEEEGIAFDVKWLKDHYVTKTMTVHPKNQSVNSTYLTLHVGWRAAPPY